MQSLSTEFPGKRPASIAARKGELTRLSLLAAARSVFAASGYFGAETSLIAKAAGKSSGVFYIYFQNKEDLLTKLTEEFRRELRTVIATPLNRPEDISTVLTALWNVYKKHAGTFIALTEASSQSKAFAEITSHLRDHARRDFVNMIRQRQKAGACPALDAKYAGAAIETMINYCLYEWLARGMADIHSAAKERKALHNLIALVQSILELPRPAARL